MQEVNEENEDPAAKRLKTSDPSPDEAGNEVVDLTAADDGGGSFIRLHGKLVHNSLVFNEHFEPALSNNLGM